MKKVTIIEVAKKAGVSVGTASQALNNKKCVAKDTIKKVEKAAQILEYYPSFTAREFRFKKSKTISLHIVIPNNNLIHPSSWNFYFRVIQGVSTELKKHGYRMHLEFNTIREVTYISHIKDTIRGYHVSGVAFLITSINKYIGIEELALLGIPLITIHGKISDNISSITIDNYNAIIQMVKWLRSMGHNNILFVSGPEDHFASQERERGYIDALVDFSTPTIISGDWTRESGYLAFKEIVSKILVPITIICANDHMALGVIQACNEFNIKVPEQISVVGFDDDMISQVITPPLSTVYQPLIELGEQAVQILLDNINDQEIKPEHKLLPAKLLIRNSVSNILG